ncbi:CsbD family protein [Glaciibacter psychrotolerans]|uniref:Uncharacterized protein YjbJ (UPF0337 family) n=1 Tax=Glaciibacter psychrotolerans TaxID=670054 RepID=A0A7Z0ED84_9MICO|nr:CsbD family protein [Leifsonia psychrotolerans]NYJ19494.1 uncharacterized protein YjbJ (UPF0337 family) [Leifsonia psychrotolerans]
MSTSDKARHEAENVKGKIKEAVGHATGDDEKVVEGKGDQASAKLKKAGDDVKDAFTS